jgi:hypothetical protein
MASREYSKAVTSPGLACPPNSLLSAILPPALAIQDKTVALHECDVYELTDSGGTPAWIKSCLSTSVAWLAVMATPLAKLRPKPKAGMRMPSRSALSPISIRAASHASDPGRCPTRVQLPGSQVGACASLGWSSPRRPPPR